METVYADTNVYLDWFKWRRGRGFMWHQGEEALSFFNDIKDGKYILLTSDHLESQIENHLPDMKPYADYIAELEAKKLHKHVVTEEKDLEQADVDAKKYKTEYEDCLHAALAIKGGATRLATQNEPHFRVLNEKIRVRRPRYIDSEW